MPHQLKFRVVVYLLGGGSGCDCRGGHRVVLEFIFDRFLEGPIMMAVPDIVGPVHVRGELVVEAFLDMMRGLL